MATYHFNLQIISRSSGRSAVATSSYTSGTSVKYVRSVVGASAYRAAEKIEDLTQNITHDFTHKSGVVYSDILIPDNAPREFSDRETLWNAVQQKERRCDSRLAREIDIALPREFEREEQIEALNKYVSDNFVNDGMCADISIHDKGDGNPHAHILLTVRDVDESGFINHDKSRKEWNKTEKLIKWRREWAEVCNEKFREKGLDIRLDHRSYEAQGIDRIPTIHLGHEAHKMEQRGIKTERGDINREITAQNLTKIKNRHIDLSKKISSAVDMSTAEKRKVQEVKTQISDIHTYKDNVQAVQQSIDNTHLEHDNTGILNINRKNILKDEIKRLEETKERFKYGFKSRFSENIDKADDLIAQLKKELDITQQSGKKRIEELEKQRAVTEFEYKKLKATAEKYYFFEPGEIDNYLRSDSYSRDINDRLVSREDEYSRIPELERERERERTITRGFDLSR